MRRERDAGHQAPRSRAGCGWGRSEIDFRSEVVVAVNAGIRHIACRDAAEFLARMSPLDPLWRGAGRSAWAFRGQKNASWSIVPSAWRTGAHLSFNDKTVICPVSFAKQCRLEADMIYTFLSAADELGLHVPGDTHVVRSPNGWLSEIEPALNREEWPPDFACETVAIAQHHGVPTRFIDLTYSSRIAAWFAADGAAAWVRHRYKKYRPKKRDRFAVWAIYLPFVRERWPMSNPRVRIVTVPRAQNRFLHAQQGFFIYDQQAAGLWGQPGNTPLSMEELIFEGQEAALRTDRARWSPFTPAVMRITAPAACAEEVLQGLDDEGIDRSHLMPTFDNVVHHLNWLRDK